jgi:hypothetical protein
MYELDFPGETLLIVSDGHDDGHVDCKDDGQVDGQAFKDQNPFSD